MASALAAADFLAVGCADRAGCADGIGQTLVTTALSGGGRCLGRGTGSMSAPGGREGKKKEHGNASQSHVSLRFRTAIDSARCALFR